MLARAPRGLEVVRRGHSPLAAGVLLRVRGPCALSLQQALTGVGHQEVVAGVAEQEVPLLFAGLRVVRRVGLHAFQAVRIDLRLGRLVGRPSERHADVRRDHVALHDARMPLHVEPCLGMDGGHRREERLDVLDVLFRVSRSQQGLPALVHRHGRQLPERLDLPLGELLCDLGVHPGELHDPCGRLAGLVTLPAARGRRLAHPDGDCLGEALHHLNDRDRRAHPGVEEVRLAGVDGHVHQLRQERRGSLQDHLQIWLQDLWDLVLGPLHEDNQQHVRLDDGRLPLPKVLLEPLELGVEPHHELLELLEGHCLGRRHRHVDELLRDDERVEDSPQALRLLDAELVVRQPQAEGLVLHLVGARVLVAAGEVARSDGERQEDANAHEREEHDGGRLLVRVEEEGGHGDPDVHGLRGRPSAAQRSAARR
mmetsp:Transcript_4209/g.10153  ORF Transcript_4209/g.10153 Transcript_4209/m.10153 type:complete len:425 (-) Transcript_4209:789-2063(-)